MRKLAAALGGTVLVTASLLIAGTAAAGASPTCAGVGALQNHGQHIVGDYVTEIGGIDGTLAWPPAGGIVGQAIRGAGAALPGTSGIHGHGGFAPGASFCLDQSASPGVHLPAS